MTKMRLYDIMRQHKACNFDEKLDFLENFLLSQEDYSEEELKALKAKFRILKFDFKRRWQLAKRRVDLFRNQNESWLMRTVELPKKVAKTERPKKSFAELSKRSKRRRTEDLRNTFDSDELTYAMQMKLRASGRTDASQVVKRIGDSPNRAKKYRKAYHNTFINNREQL